MALNLGGLGLGETILGAIPGGQIFSGIGFGKTLDAALQQMGDLFGLGSTPEPPALPAGYHYGTHPVFFDDWETITVHQEGSEFYEGGRQQSSPGGGRQVSGRGSV